MLPKNKSEIIKSARSASHNFMQILSPHVQLGIYSMRIRKYIHDKSVCQPQIFLISKTKKRGGEGIHEFDLMQEILTSIHSLV